MKSIILLGMKHVGKSSIGRILAKAFGLPFYDLDHQLIKKARPGETGATAREIYRKEGLEGFQFWEKAAAQELAGSQKAMILALGGRDHRKPAGDGNPGKYWYFCVPSGKA
jgi:shikimate kinase